MPQEESMEVRSAIQRTALEHRRRYGYRRVTAELRRRGMLVNHKRVARIMREDNLLAMQPKQFVTTTDSDHALEIYMNLARRMTLSAVDQLWIADITYIRLKSEWVYLALVLDGFSRKVVGWKLDRTLASRLAIEALEDSTSCQQLTQQQSLGITASHQISTSSEIWFGTGGVGRLAEPQSAD